MDSLFGTPLKGASDGRSKDPLFGTPLQGADPSTQDEIMPRDVRNAEQVTGQHDLDGLCETAVEQWAGLPNMGATAYDAWNNWQTKGKATPGINGIQPGDILYWSPNDGNQGAGHTSIYKGNGKMMSATYQGVREDDVADWSRSTGQMPLGYVSLNQAYGN